jgi:hypothetical protein
MKTVREEWQGYAGHIFHGLKPSAHQYNETQKAFYAGMAACWANAQAIGEPEVSEAEGMRWFSEIGVELREFLDKFRAEYERDGPRLMDDMTEPELSEYFRSLMDIITASQPADVLGSILLMFGPGITQYASSVERKNVPQALREAAHAIDSRTDVQRSGG